MVFGAVTCPAVRLFPWLFLIAWTLVRSRRVGRGAHATRAGRWTVPSPDRAIGDPSASPRDFAWRCGIAIEMLSILYGSICDRCDLDVHRRSDAYTRLTVGGRSVGACGGRGRRAGRALGGRARESATPTGDRVGIPLSSGCFPPSPTAPTRRTHIHIDRDTPGKTLGHRPPGDPSAHGRSECSAMPLRNGGSAQARPSQQSE